MDFNRCCLFLPLANMPVLSHEPCVLSPPVCQCCKPGWFLFPLPCAHDSAPHLIWVYFLPCINFLPFSLFTCFSFCVLKPYPVKFSLSDCLSSCHTWCQSDLCRTPWGFFTSACFCGFDFCLFSSSVYCSLRNFGLSTCVWLLSWLQTLSVFWDFFFCLLSWTIFH